VRIAATHWLTSGFAIPFVIALIVGIPVALIIGVNNAVALSVGMSVVWIFSLWLGVMYSAKYLEKTYIINDSQKIAKLSAIYLAVIGGGFRLITMSRKGASLDLIVDFIFFAIGVAIFYVLSKKYIHNTQADEASPINIQATTTN
jgi:hypothetical protein